MTKAQRRRQARARQHWTPPGPMPPGDRGLPHLMPQPGETLDAHAGHWRIFQLKKGHRYSTDDLLAAWCAVDTLTALDRTPHHALDLGTGIGSVALFLAWHWADLQITGVELQPRSLALARRSAEYNGIQARSRWLEGDVRILQADAAYDLVTGSPPYWHPDDGVISEGPQKGAARFELTGTVEAYARAAARHLADDGLVALVFDGRQMTRLTAALQAAELHVIRMQPVISREGDEPLLVIAAASKSHGVMGGCAPPPGWREPLLLRQSDGRRSEPFRALRLAMGLPPGRR